MSKEMRKKRGVSMALSFALALVGASRPIPWLIVVACIAIALSLLYAFWNWASKPSLSTVEKLARPTILFVVVSSVSIIYGFQFWPKIKINPSEIAHWKQYIEYTFSVTNKTDDDAYLVLTRIKFSTSPRDFEFRPISAPLKAGDKPEHVLLRCNNPPVIYLTSHHLAPGEKTVLVVRYTKEQEASASAEVVSFSKDQVPNFDGPIGTWSPAIAIPFTLDGSCSGWDIFAF